jgi:hypothetical protein
MRKIAWKIKVEVDPGIVSSPCFRLETKRHFVYIWRNGWRPGVLLAPIEYGSDYS